MQRKRVAILISGRGSNMAALISAAADPDYPAEIAAVIKFLASADASYLTGQVVTVDGGLTPGRY